MKKLIVGLGLVVSLWAGLGLLGPARVQAQGNCVVCQTYLRGRCVVWLWVCRQLGLPSAR